MGQSSKQTNKRTDRQTDGHRTVMQTLPNTMQATSINDVYLYLSAFLLCNCSVIFMAFMFCAILLFYGHLSVQESLADLGFFRVGDFGNPSERSKRALRGLGLRENQI